MEIYKQHTDRQLLREDLKYAIEDRFRKVRKLQELAMELRLAVRPAAS
jgi:hypothetical protein